MKVTMISHATLLIELGGLTILTDPWLSEKAGHLVHKEPPAMTAEELPEIDIIMATCNASAHFDKDTLKQLDSDITVLTTKGELEEAAKALGFTMVFGLEPGDLVEIPPLTIEATSNQRGIGFLVEGEGRSFFYPGPTRRNERLFRLRDRGRVDVALLPIEGNRYPDISRDQLNAREAAELSNALDARTTIPVGFDQAIAARFDPEVGPLKIDWTASEFEKQMSELHPRGKVVVLENGESWSGD